MPFASAVSEHPLATHAVGEVVGAVLERLGPEPDLVVVFVTGPFAGALDDVANAVRELLRPAALIGATAVSVLAGDREIEEEAAIVVFAASWDGRLRGGPKGIRTVRFDADRTDDGWHLTGSDDLTAEGGTLILLAEPASFPVEGFLDELHHRNPAVTVVGGLASVRPEVGANRLVIDGDHLDRGAVGVFLPDGVPVRTVVSQGCRPVGEPLVVTAARGNLIEEIAGRPALERLMETADSVSPEDRSAMARGLQLGIVLDERREEFVAGDFVIRNVLGADRANGAVAVGADVEVGTTVQFQVRDADSAAADLQDALAGEAVAGALVFTCNGRGRHLFGVPHHDATAVNAHVAGDATAGMFCAGEIAPVAGRPFLHGFTAALVLFDA